MAGGGNRSRGTPRGRIEGPALLLHIADYPLVGEWAAKEFDVTILASLNFSIGLPEGCRNPDSALDLRKSEFAYPSGDPDRSDLRGDDQSRRIVGAVPRLVPLQPEDGEWRLDADALGAIVTDRTRAIFVAKPGMPTGNLLNDDEWDAIASLCRERDLWLVYLAWMERILFDGTALPAPGFPAGHGSSGHPRGLREHLKEHVAHAELTRQVWDRGMRGTD